MSEPTKHTPTPAFDRIGIESRLQHQRPLRDSLAMLAEIDRLIATLQTIRDQQGKVCTCFDHCDHVGCQSSYAAWEIADAALRGVETKQS